MAFILSSIIFTILLFCILILIFQGKNGDSEQNMNLSSWKCKYCGYDVQMGDFCTYCYTKKEK